MAGFMNAANEVLVSRFIQNKISWKQIGQKLEKLMEKHIVHPVLSIEAVLEVDSRARQEAAVV